MNDEYHPDKLAGLRDAQGYRENDVRALRDTVYGKPISDKEWAGCYFRWMRPDSVAWLREKASKPITLPA